MWLNFISELDNDSMTSGLRKVASDLSYQDAKIHSATFQCIHCSRVRGQQVRGQQDSISENHVADF